MAATQDLSFPARGLAWSPLISQNFIKFSLNHLNNCFHSSLILSTPTFLVCPAKAKSLGYGGSWNDPDTFTHNDGIRLYLFMIKGLRYVAHYSVFCNLHQGFQKSEILTPILTHTVRYKTEARSPKRHLSLNCLVVSFKPVICNDSSVMSLKKDI